MKSIFSQIIVIPFVLLSLTLSGCGDPQTAANDQATDPAVKTVAAQTTVAPSTKLTIQKNRKLTYTKSFDGFFNGALGSIKVVQGTGVDIPTTPCTGTKKQIHACKDSREKALALNPTSFEVLVNGQVVIAKGAIPRTQGTVTVAIAVNVTNTLQVNLEGPKRSYVTISGTSENTPPLQNPTAAFTFNPTSGGIPLTVAFDASSSSSPNGSIVNYNWDYGDGSSTSGNFQTSHEYNSAGTFAITLTVIDSAGKSATVTSQIVVSPPQIPVATFFYTVDSSTGQIIVTSDGSSSSSANGQIIEYFWDWGDGSALDTGTLASHLYGAQGTYSVTLFIQDNMGVFASVTQTITIP